MTPDRWQQLDRLMDEALALPAQERADFLAQIPSAEMRREIASWLDAHAEAETGFLNQPAVASALPELASDGALTGERFGSYQILSVLGVGGMGEVYLAHDERLRRRLALKILPPPFVADAARVERFAREARAVSALNHPNIVTVYDIGQLDNTHFIAMEHVEGQTLRERMQTRLEVSEVIEIALQIAAALAAAHEAGIIHRDIKPENVMLRRDDYVKVLDFGLAKLTEVRSEQRSKLECGVRSTEKQSVLLTPHSALHTPHFTKPGTVLGTLRYMSPEQALGKDVDARSDLFSLGVVLYEALAGSPPFKGDTPAATLDAVAHHTPLPLTSLRPDVPAECERLVHRLLEKDRELRYQTAGDLRAALKRLKREVDSSSAHSLSSGAVPSVKSSWRPRAIAVTVLALLALSGFAAWQWWPNAPSPWLMNAHTTRLTDLPGEERNPSVSADGKTVFYAWRIKGQWDVFRLRVGGSNPTNLTAGHDANDLQPACSPNGESLVFRSDRDGGGLYLMGATGENVRLLTRFGHNPAWSPDGKFIVCGTDYIYDPKRRSSKSRLLVINVADGHDRVLLDAHDAAQPRWSPHGQRIAYLYRNANNQHDVWTVAADGSDARAVTDDAAVDWNPVWSGDGQSLFFASDRKGAPSIWRVRIDETSGRALGPPEPVTGQSSEILAMDVARDTQRIVYTNFIQDANLKAVAFDPLKLVTVGESLAVTSGTRPSGSPDVAPDGQSVVFHSLGAAREDIWRVTADGQSTPTNLTDDEPLDRSPRWSPDGRQLVFLSERSNSPQIWLMNADGGAKRQLTFSEYECNYPFWSPDGKHVGYWLTGTAKAGAQRGTQIIEANQPWQQQTPATLPPVSEANEAGEWFYGYVWSPDGQFIAGTTATLQGKEVRDLPGIVVYSLATRRYERLTDFGNRPAWLADNRHVAFTFNGKGRWADNHVLVVNRTTKFVTPILASAGLSVSTVALTRDSRRMIYTAVAHQSDIYLLSLDQ